MNPYHGWVDLYYTGLTYFQRMGGMLIVFVFVSFTVSFAQPSDEFLSNDDDTAYEKWCWN